MSDWGESGRRGIVTTSVVTVPEPFAQASTDRAYVTPLFPDGIRRTVLSL